MNIIGIDLGKNIFHICIMNKSGRVLRRMKCTRRQVVEKILNQEKGVVVMEACGGSHHWARVFQGHGYEVRIMSAKFVKPFVKSNKNDSLDAEAICEAALRPQMRFVSPKSEHQQDIQIIHRIRTRLVKERTAISNEIRGFLLEYGVVLPKGVSQIRNNLVSIIEQEKEHHSSMWVQTFFELYEEFHAIDSQVKLYDKKLKGIAQTEQSCKRLLKVPGVGPITATAIVSSIGNPKDFSNSRQFAAYLGLVPRQYSTGGKERLGGISKRGDKYIRRLLVQGARSAALAMVKKKNQDATTKWYVSLAHRRGANKAVVALANKTARRIWQVLMGNDFKQPEELENQYALAA